MISSLRLKNFVAFTEMTIEFSPGINIIIGENSRDGGRWHAGPHHHHANRHGRRW